LSHLPSESISLQFWYLAEACPLQYQTSGSLNTFGIFHTEQHESHDSSGNLALELNGIVSYFVLLVGESLEVLTVSSQSFYQQPFSFVLDLINGLLFTDCAVGCAVQPSAFNDTNTISSTLTPKMPWKVWQV
jgi:hypothetical protein